MNLDREKRQTIKKLETQYQEIVELSHFLERKIGVKTSVHCYRTNASPSFDKHSEILSQEMNVSRTL